MTRRIAWTLKDLARATGMSVAFWKKVIANGGIAITKAGARTLVLDDDLQEWLLANRCVRRGSRHSGYPMPDSELSADDAIH